MSLGGHRYSSHSHSGDLRMRLVWRIWTTTQHAPHSPAYGGPVRLQQRHRHQRVQHRHPHIRDGDCVGGVAHGNARSKGVGNCSARHHFGNKGHHCLEHEHDVELALHVSRSRADSTAGTGYGKALAHPAPYTHVQVDYYDEGDGQQDAADSGTDAPAVVLDLWVGINR